VWLFIVAEESDCTCEFVFLDGLVSDVARVVRYELYRSDGRESGGGVWKFLVKCMYAGQQRLINQISLARETANHTHHTSTLAIQDSTPSKTCIKIETAIAIFSYQRVLKRLFFYLYILLDYSPICFPLPGADETTARRSIFNSIFFSSPPELRQNLLRGHRRPHRLYHRQPHYFERFHSKY
jgi:hypothetical protein